MDRKIEIEHLRIADAHISAARERITRQVGLIARLEEGGHGTTAAHEILQTMRDTLGAMEDHRRAIQKEIASYRD